MNKEQLYPTVREMEHFDKLKRQLGLKDELLASASNERVRDPKCEIRKPPRRQGRQRGQPKKH